MDQIGQLVSATKTQQLSDNFLALIKIVATAMRYTGTRDESNREYQEFLHSVEYLLGLGQSEADEESSTERKKESEIRKTQNSIRYGHFYLDIEKFNACMHTLNQDAETKLHVAARECRCANDSEAAYKETIDSVIIFIVLNTDMLNERDRNGRTALMMAAENGCLHIVRVLVDWANEHDGVKVDLNAEDIYGETALFKAVLCSRVEVVEFLVQLGALDICDNRGFSALFAAICGPRNNAYETLFCDFFCDFYLLTFMEQSFILTNETCNIYAQCLKQLESETRNYGKTVKLIEVLLHNYRGSITAKDLRDNTALDWAVRSKARISELTVNKINQMMQPDRQTNTGELMCIDELGRTSFHRLVAILPFSRIRRSDLFVPISHKASNIRDINFGPFKTMTCRKDSRGRTALHYAAMTINFLYVQSNAADKIEIFETVVKLGCSVNETDVYGRTPLHYATEAAYKSLLKVSGADETIKDIDNNTPLDLRKLQQIDESDSEEVQEQLNLDEKSEYVNIWEIWTSRKYAFLKPISGSLIQEMKCFINRLAEGIGKMDPRFECRPVLVGSAYEGTKLGFMNEFDFDLVLTKFSECCDVCPAPEAPVGFVRLQRKLNPSSDETSVKRLENELNFDKFFNNNGVLISNKVASRFRCLYSEVMMQPHFWESEPYFEWYLPCELDAFVSHYGVNPGRYHSQADLRSSRKLGSTIRLTLNRPINGQYLFTLTSVDIVPCIRLAGWWPDGISSSVPNDLRAEGCYLVFDQPQNKYPWVPYSTDPYVRISFAEAESRLVKESSDLAKAAYMVVKRMLPVEEEYKFTHVWKNSLLYCIEALNDDRNKNMNYEQISKEDLRLLVEKLMLCFLEFYRQDFCPCYVMPSYSLPIGREFKSHHKDELWGYKNEEFYKLYQSVCEGSPEIPYSEPVVQPLFEYFDRDELLRKLSKFRASENFVAQPSESSEPTLALMGTISLELRESERQEREPSIIREEDGTLLYSRDNVEI